MAEDTNQLTDAEIESVVEGMLTEEDLRKRSQALHDTQEIWEKVAYLSEEKMPCRECGGTGSVHGGGFGNICLGCGGTRVEIAPGAEEFQMPVDFTQLRNAITAYGNALSDRELPEGHKGKRHLLLPAASTVVTLEKIEEIKKQGLAKTRELRQLGAASRGVDARQLPEGRPARGLAGEGELGEYDDAELADMEDDANRRRP